MTNGCALADPFGGTVAWKPTCTGQGAPVAWLKASLSCSAPATIAARSASATTASMRIG